VTDYHILIRSMTQVSWSEHNILFRGLVMMGKPESVSRRQMVAHNDPTNKEASDHLRGNHEVPAVSLESQKESGYLKERLQKAG